MASSSVDKKVGELYVVATPIGNLEDITLRAISTLNKVSIIFAEDTRVSRILLERINAGRKFLKSLNARTEKSKSGEVLEFLRDGQDVVLITDAGTPAISDPGSFLIERIRAEGFNVIPIPGPNSVATALSASGVPASEFLFLGFLPHKKGRETLFSEIAEAKRTVVFFESPHRIMKTLEKLTAILGQEKKVVIARELTKVFEEFVEGSPKEVLEHFKNNPDKVKGEFVVIVSRV